MKTRDSLIDELIELRRKVAVLESATSGNAAQPTVGLAVRQAPAEAPAKSELLESIVSNAPLIVWAVDRHGLFILSEGKDLKSLGLKPGEVVGRSVYDFYRDTPKVAENTRRALAGESLLVSVEVGGIIFATWQSPLCTAAGEIVGAVGVALDVTKHKLAEEQLLAERRLMKEMLRSHERDRRLTAYEIHDGLVQDVTAAQMRLEALLSSNRVPGGPARDEINTALDLVRKAVRETCDLISGLRPPILDERGVVAAIEYLIHEQPTDGPWFDLTVQVQFDRLEPLLEGTIYRIVQEAVTNVKRHSKSAQTEIRLTQTGDRIQVEIQDWGVGFDPKSIAGKRLGLQGIRERARLLHGWATIDSAPGKGTRVHVDLPIASAPTEAAIMNNGSYE